MRALVTAIMTGLFAATAAHGDTIKLAADNWCPYNCEANAKNKGFVVEVAEYALAKIGHKIDYTTMSWTRTVQEVVAGRVDGAVAAGDVDVRDNALIVGKETTGTSVNCVYADDKQPLKFTSAPDLKKFKKVATVQDYFYGDDIAALQKSDPGLFETMTGDDPPARNIVKLKAGRVEAILEDQAVMAYTIKKNKITGVKMIGCDPHKVNLFLAFSPKNPNAKTYAAAVDAAMAELRKTGQLKTILAKYGLKDWK